MTVSPEIQEAKPVTSQESSKNDQEAIKPSEIPQHIEKGVGGVSATQVSATTQDDTGLIKAQDDKSVKTVVVPESSEQLQNEAKGDPENAITWFANFWLRIIKKAMRFGWKVVGGQPKQIPHQTTPQSQNQTQTSNQKQQ